MVSPVTVRLSGPRVERHVDEELVGGVKFSAAVPRGFLECSFTLRRPVRILPGDTDAYVNVTIYDRRTGETLWDGWLEVPGRRRDGVIEIAEVRAVGPAAHATDNQRPLIYVDGRYSEWERATDTAVGTVAMPAAQVSTTGGAGDTPGLRSLYPRGLVVPANGYVTMRYPHLVTAQQQVGRVDHTHISGTQPVWQNQIRTFPSLGTPVTATGQTWSTASQSQSATRGGTIGLTDTYVDLRTINATGGTVANDVTWTLSTLLRVQAARYAASGAALNASSDYATSYLLPHQVIADLLGRPGLLPLYDGTFARVSAASTVQLQQLAYEKGIDPAGVLADLMEADPAFYWAAWERSRTTGKYRFEWASWPTTPTIYGDGRDGFDAPSSAADLYDVAWVNWQDELQRNRWNRYTSSAPLLAAAGRSRSRVVDLGSQAGSPTQAAAAGASALAAGRWPINNGTWKVRRPVLDLTTGRSVYPWQLPKLAGRLVRLADVEARPDVLNASSRDGQSTFRIAQVEYDDVAREAICVLDTYAGDVAAAIARLSRQVARTGQRP